MSANNQILIKYEKGKFYVFDNIMAESWSLENELSKQEASGVFYSESDAEKKAFELYQAGYEEGFPVEYGIVRDVLFKDGAKVHLRK